MNRRPESTVLFHSLRVRKRNEKQKELRERREEKVKDPYIVSCETTTSGSVSNYRRGVDSTVRFSRRDKGGGRREGAPRSRERKVRIRGVGESHTGHRTGTIFFRCPPFSIYSYAQDRLVAGSDEEGQPIEGMKFRPPLLKREKTASSSLDTSPSVSSGVKLVGNELATSFRTKMIIDYLHRCCIILYSPLANIRNIKNFPPRVSSKIQIEITGRIFRGSGYLARCCETFNTIIWWTRDVVTVHRIDSHRNICIMDGVILRQNWNRVIHHKLGVRG